MTNLDEAIKHCEEVATENEKTKDCIECAKEHRQLAEWLRELKTYKDYEDKGYVMCRVVATQDIQSRTTRVILDVNTEKLFNNNVEVNADE